MKTAKEILKKYLEVDNTPLKGNEWIVDAMEEYAALVEERSCKKCAMSWNKGQKQETNEQSAEVSDEDIEKYYLKIEPRGYGCSFYNGLVKGAQAMRDGLIKKG